MHYHVAGNPNYGGAAFPDWYIGKYFSVLPEVTSEELASSTISCAIRNTVIAVKPVGDKTLEVLVNNNGRRSDFTPRQLVDFLKTCGKKGDSVSIDDTLISTFIGKAIETELVKVFGEDGYLLTSGRVPDEDYLRKVLPARASMQRAPVTQQRPRR